MASGVARTEEFHFCNGVFLFHHGDVGQIVLVAGSWKGVVEDGVLLMGMIVHHVQLMILWCVPAVSQ